MLFTVRRDETYCFDPLFYKKKLVVQLPQGWILERFLKDSNSVIALEHSGEEGYDKDWWVFYELKPDLTAEENLYRIPGHSPYFLNVILKKVSETSYLRILQVQDATFMLGEFKVKPTNKKAHLHETSTETS